MILLYIGISVNNGTKPNVLPTPPSPRRSSRSFTFASRFFRDAATLSSSPRSIRSFPRLEASPVGVAARSLAPSPSSAAALSQARNLSPSPLVSTLSRALTFASGVGS